MFIAAVSIAVAPIEPMLGAVMHNFVPSLSFAVLLHDSFLWTSIAVAVLLGASASPLGGTSGNGLFKVTDLPL